MFDLTLFLPPLFCPPPPPLISFPAKKFKKVLGKETYSETLESTPSLEKEKFPQDYFPEVSVLDKWRWIGTLRAHIAPISKSLFLISGSVSLLGLIIQNCTIELQKLWFYLSLFYCATSHQIKPGTVASRHKYFVVPSTCLGEVQVTPSAGKTTWLSVLSVISEKYWSKVSVPLITKVCAYFCTHFLKTGGSK